KLVRAERHPFRLGVSLQVIFAQIWAVIRQAIFARDHQNAPSETFLSQRLRRHVAGRAAAQDHKCAFILPRVAWRHRRRAAILRRRAATLRASRNGPEAPPAFYLYLETRNRDKRGWSKQIARLHVKGGVMPGTDAALAAQPPFRERPAVVRANCSNRMIFTI